MTFLFTALAALASPRAFASPSAVDQDPNCQNPLVESTTPSREQLVATILRANAEGPQRDDFVYLKVIARYLIEPVPSSLLTADLTVDEFNATKERMTRAHHAYGIEAYVAMTEEQCRLFGAGPRDLPKGKRIELDRIVGLIDGPFWALGILLEVLAQDIENIPVRERREHRNVPFLVYDKLSEFEKSQLWAYNDDYFVHTKDEIRKARLKAWGLRLSQVLTSPKIRAATEAHRNYVVEQHRALGKTWAKLRAEESHAGALGREIYEAAREEFGSIAADRPFMTFVQSLIAMYHGCPRPERSLTSFPR